MPTSLLTLFCVRSLPLVISLVLTRPLAGAEHIVAPPHAAISPDAGLLIRQALQAAGGEAHLLRHFQMKDRVLIGEQDTGAGNHRESVLDAPRAWWLKTKSGHSERTGEPAKYLVWAWTLQALVDPASRIEVVSPVTEGAITLRGLRVSGSVSPAMELYFAPDSHLLVRIDWRNDIHRFSDWKTLPRCTRYSSRVVGSRKATGKIWYFDEILEITPLDALPEGLPPVR